MDTHAVNVYARNALGTFLTPGKYTPDTKKAHEVYKSTTLYVMRELFERKLRSNNFLKTLPEVSQLIFDTQAEVDKTQFFENGCSLAYASAIVYACLGRLTLASGLECVIQKGRFVKSGAGYVYNGSTITVQGTTIKIVTPAATLSVKVTAHEIEQLAEFFNVQEDCNLTAILSRSKSLATSDSLWSADTKTLAEVATRAAITVDVAPYSIKVGPGCIDV